MADIAGLVTEFNRYQEEFQKKAQDMLKVAFTEFFEQNPNIAALRWNQYTPYFNDGDECIFSVHELSYQVASEEDDEFHEAWYDEAHPEEQAAAKEFGSLIQTIPDDVYKAMFGDHVEITATRDGFQVEEYEHE